MPQITALQKNCQEKLAIDFAASADECSKIIDYVTQISGNVFPYDNRIFAPDWDVKETPVDNFFSDANTQSANIYEQIHVKPGVDGDKGSIKSPIFEMSSSRVGTAFEGDNLKDYSEYVLKLIEAKSPVLIYAGEFDAQDGPKTQEYWLRRLNFTDSDKFWSQSRQIYWVNNFTDSQNALINGGYWRTSDYFEYLTVPKAGHFVPNNYFSASHQFITDYIAG